MGLFYGTAAKALRPEDAGAGAGIGVFATAARACAEAVLYARLICVAVCAATLTAASVSSAFLDGALAGPIPSASVEYRRNTLGV